MNLKIIRLIERGSTQKEYDSIYVKFYSRYCGERNDLPWAGERVGHESTSEPSEVMEMLYLLDRDVVYMFL